MPRAKDSPRVNFEVPLHLVRVVKYYAQSDERSPNQWLKDLLLKEIERRQYQQSSEKSFHSEGHHA